MIHRMFDRAFELSEEGQVRAAIGLYDEITDAEPRLFEAWFNKAVAYEQVRDFEGAVGCYYRAVDLKPNNQDATRGLGIMLFNVRQFRKARYWLEKAIRNGDPHPALATLAQRSKDLPSDSNLVFVSYSWADRGQVDDQILPVLEAEGIEYFIDRDRIPQDDEMEGLRWQIEQGVAQCDALLLAWSSSARGSHYVNQELCSALGMIRNVVLVLLDDMEFPGWLRAGVRDGTIAPVPVGDAVLLAERAGNVEDIAGRVRRTNCHARVLRESPSGVNVDLIALDGGLMADFAIGRYPVTQAQWAAVMGANPSAHQGDDTRPVECVSWHEAQEFCGRLNASTDRSYRLPNEAEWEFACRAGSLGNWCFGDSEGRLHEFAWYIDNTAIGSQPGTAAFAIDGTFQGVVDTSPHQTNSVYTKRSNDWGLFHMHGNVSEWCSDDAGEDGNLKRVRGGAYNNAPRSLRCAARGSFAANERDDDVGFRICRSI
ncbi:MAG: SUMF1/EgtB/PvdO family nonheme iron enzyme [bacterium]|nr:SUMF1/EgtB/PvdO family nonheme iron enzyme [bacterium]